MKRTIFWAAAILASLLLPLSLSADTYDTATLVSIRVTTKEELDALYACNYDIVSRSGDFYKVLLKPAELESALARGMEVEILYDEMESDRQLFATPGWCTNTSWPCYWYPSKFNTTNPATGTIMRHLLDLYDAHPTITRLYNLGATQDGAYDIIAMKITKNPDLLEAEPKLRIYANIHGDEVCGLMIACDVLDWILDNYATNATAQKLVDESEMWFIPMGNPYGNAHQTRYNGNSVDLNRNFWGPAGSDEPPAWSEAETRAIRDLTETATADHPKKRFATGLSFHGGAACFNSVYNYTSTATTDEPVFFSSRSGGPYNSECGSLCANPAANGLAKAYQDGCTMSGFWYTNGADWYITHGDTNDWSYASWTTLDTTLEAHTTKWPDSATIPTYTAQHRQAVLNYLLKGFQGVHGVMTDAQTGAPLDGTVTATCTASSTIPVPHAYQAIYTDPVAGDFHRVLQPGTYTIACNCTGYPTTTITGVVVTADTKTLVNCPMGTACANNPSGVNVTPDGPIALCAGSGQLLTAAATGGVGLSYQWTIDGADISGAASSTYYATDSGTHSYNCKVKGTGCAASVVDPSGTQIAWQAAPLFAGAASVTNPQSATCTLDVAWSAASSACPGTITYKAYRSATTPVPILPGNLVASDLTGTSYSDDDGLVSGTAYYYVVRAVDGLGQEDGNTVEKSGIPTGPGSGTTTYPSTDVPKTIPDNTTVTSTIGVSGANALADVNVTIGSLIHTYDSDLDIYLIAPDGTRVELSTDNGASGDNYTNTVFDDSAATAITSGTAPFTGSFRPEGSLATLNGKSPNGTWTLEVSDDASSDTGTLNGWSLSLATSNPCTTGTPCTAPASPTLTGATGTCSGVELAWAPGSGTTLSYNVYRKDAPCGGAYTQIGGPLAVTTYRDVTAVAGASYAYVVRGSCSEGGAVESGDSNCLTAARLASPTPGITGASANACPAETVVLTTEPGKSNYQWYSGGSPIGGADAYQYTVRGTGSYTVSYTDTNGCSGTSAAHPVTITACAPALVYQGHGSFTEITGDGDGVMEAGEKYSVSVTLQNAGNVTASAVQASLTGMAGGDGITACDNPRSFGDIAAGGTASATFSFVVNGAVWYGTYSCGTGLTFNVVNKSTATANCACADQMAVFSNSVGVAGSSQTATQATSPLTASNSTVSSNLSPAFAITSPDTATLSYTSGYTPPSGSPATLFGPDDLASLGSWTAVGYSASSANTCSGHTAAAARSSNAAGTYTLTKTTAVSTVGYTNITVGMDWRVTSSTLATQYLDWSTNGASWNLGAASTTSAAMLCAQSVALPSGAAGQATLYIRFRTVATGSARGIVDYISIGGTPPGSGSWTSNVRVSLVDPSSTATVLKAYGAGDGSPYNVKAYYTGPGTYQLRLEENAGGTATLTSGSMNVTAASNCGTGSGTCGFSGPPRVPYSTTPTRILKNNADATNVAVNFDNANCSSTRYGILYGWGENLSAWTVTGNGGCNVAPSTSATNWSGMPSAAGHSFLWFLVVGNNASTTEGSWGLTSSGAQRGGATASGQCSCTTKDTTTPCGIN